MVVLVLLKRLKLLVEVTLKLKDNFSDKLNLRALALVLVEIIGLV